jgi:hypothetical protein
VLLVEFFATAGQPYFLLAPQLISDTDTIRIAADKMIFFIVWIFNVLTKVEYLAFYIRINAVPLLLLCLF